MSIKMTRTCIDAILNGSIQNAEFVKDPVWGFDVPMSPHGVEEGVLDLRLTWKDPSSYDAMSKKLVGIYVDNSESMKARKPLLTPSLDQTTMTAFLSALHNVKRSWKLYHTFALVWSHCSLVNAMYERRLGWRSQLHPCMMNHYVY